MLSCGPHERLIKNQFDYHNFFLVQVNFPPRIQRTGLATTGARDFFDATGNFTQP